MDKNCSQNAMAYGHFKDLLSRTAADRVFHNKTFNIDKNPKYDKHQSGLASIVF